MVNIGTCRHSVPLLQIEPGSSYVTVLEIRKILQQLIERGHGAVGQIKFLLCKSLVKEQFQRAVIIAHRLGELTAVLTRHTSHLIGVGDKRVALYGCGGILFSPEEIVKVQFCDSPEKIWLCQIRLGVYRLVEILYGEHVVLEIEGVLPYAKHLLRIYLGRCAKRLCKPRNQ